MIRRSPVAPAQGEEMGRITIAVRVENNFDVRRAEEGQIPFGSVRTLEIDDALVDTGATGLCLPESMVRELGLTAVRRRSARTAAGITMLTVYSEVRLTILDRDAVIRITEIPDGSPVLVGQIPLEEMDLIPYPKERKLKPNPAHDGEWTIEIY